MMRTRPSDPNRLLRRRMVDEQIRARGVRDERVLRAMEEVPRERFVRPEDTGAAFSDHAISIGMAQTISQPFMVAAMTAAMELAPDHRILEIGTGSGYQTAVLATLARHVYTIERIEPLQEISRSRLDKLGVTNVSYRVGDGTLGWPQEAPFDRIIVTAGAPDAPQPLLDQLADGGRLVIPIGNQSEQTLTVIERHGTTTRERPHFPCRFVKLIGQQAWAEPPQGDTADPQR